MLESVMVSLGLFVGLLAGIEAGLWLGRRRQAAGEDASPGSAAAEGVVLAVLGLLIAFTFTASASRFQERRQLIVAQANALGTAYLRTDLLPAEDRPAIRQRMARWVHLTLDLPRHIRNSEQAQAQAIAELQRLQEEVWQLSVASLNKQPAGPTMPFVLAPLNEWIDLSTTRVQLNNLGMPRLVSHTLVVLSLLGSVLAGYGMSKRPSRSPLHILAFAGVLALSIYVIHDLNDPRQGLITVDSADDAMRQLSASFESNPSLPTTTPDAKR